jgi:UDP-glucose 4-epimerase
MDIGGAKFLVTGGSGFIGSHVVDRLVAEGAGEVVVFDARPRTDNLAEALEHGNVRIVEGDVGDSAALAQAATGVDGVFHLAVLPLGPCSEDPRRCLDVNVVGTFNVLNAARQAGARKVVFSSASSVYGDTNETMDESHPLGARTMYGGSKIAGEYFVRAFHDLYGLDYVILRYMNVYGPRQDGGLVINVLRRIQSGEPPTIMGDGSQSFDFVHVADVAGANVRAMASDVGEATLNVGGGNEVTVREIVGRLIELSGSSVEPEIRADVDVPMTRRVGSSERAAELIGWEPEYDLDRGLQDVVAKT